MVKSFDLPQVEAPQQTTVVKDSMESVKDPDAQATSTEELVDRGNWSNPIEFILSCLNYAVGLGNVWRFPYLAFRNGGGAFLIPYFLMVFILGIPIFFAELFTGQFSGLGPIKAYSFIAPFFKGLGFCALVVTVLVSIYYMVIVAWVLYYLWTSFFPDLVWGNCDNEWNTPKCYSIRDDIACQVDNTNTDLDKIFYNLDCRIIRDLCASRGLIGINANWCRNMTVTPPFDVPISEVIERALSAEEFYYEKVLGLGDATWTNEWGWPQWHLVLCLALAWLIGFFCVIKGVASVGKVVYFTATFPYLILTALLIRALTLEGAIDGIWFYITPEWERLAAPAVWGDASSQIFFSFSLAFGALVTFASYNKFSNNCHFDVIFVSITNFFTAIFSGFVVFSILGFLSHQMSVPVDEVVASGPGLTFITYPEAVLLMPLPQLWAILFFFMMLILGLGSMFGSIQLFSTTIIDRWPHLREHQWRVTAGSCLFCFIAGIPMTCNGGIYLFTIMDWHSATWAILLIGLAEVVVLSWVYGIGRTLDNLHDMGMKLRNNVVKHYYWKSVWLVITPGTCIAVFVFRLTVIQPTQYRGYIFPVWADTMGWLLGASTLVPFVVFAIIQTVQNKGSFKDLFKPTANWGPQEVDGRRVDRTQLVD